MTQNDGKHGRELNPVLEGAREGLAEGARSTVRWAFFGAAGGALVLGGFGLVRFGALGLVVGSVAGGILGGLAARGESRYCGKARSHAAAP